MDLLPDDQEAALVSAARALLGDLAPSTRLREAHDSPTGILEDLWQAAADQGWFAVATPESAGGLGLSVAEAALLATEIGASLAPGPWAATIAAGAALHADEVGARAASGTKIASGIDTRGAAAVIERQGRLWGSIPRVEFPVEGSVLLVDVDGELWCAESFDGSPKPTIDPGVRVAGVDLDGAPARPTGCATESFARIYDLLVAARLSGVARQSAVEALEYAKVREQFGKPIGAFQSVKHRLADAFVRAERADCLVSLAALAERDLGGAPREMAGARMLAADAAIANSGEAVLIHGAIGYTWECDAHLYLKRARALAISRLGERDLVNSMLEAPAIPAFV